jgi:hypothetical protein
MRNRRFSLRVPVTAALAALAVAAAGLLYRYIRYRAQRADTYTALYNTTWGEGARDMEIEYEKCLRPRFRGISFLRSASIMCGGHYNRQPWGIEVSLVAFVKDVDFDGMRIAASSGGAVDIPFGGGRGVVEAYRGGYYFKIQALVQQDAIPTRLDAIAPLQVAFIRDGEAVGSHADLYFLRDHRSEYTPEQAEQWTRRALGSLEPLRPVSSCWPDGPTAGDATGPAPLEEADASSDRPPPNAPSP